MPETQVQSENDKNLELIRAAQAQTPRKTGAQVAQVSVSTAQNEENLALIADASRKKCPKCDRPMSTGGTSRWVCLYDGTAAA
jgi:hypothetical protein